MRIGSILENQNIEKRIAITPEIVKKYISLGFELCLSENYGSHLGIEDKQYKDMGVDISKDEKEVLNSSDIIVQLGMPSDDKNSIIKENQTLIGTRIWALDFCLCAATPHFYNCRNGEFTATEHRTISGSHDVTFRPLV